jgi:hypothetical protein
MTAADVSQYRPDDGAGLERERPRLTQYLMPVTGYRPLRGVTLHTIDEVHHTDDSACRHIHGQR